VRQSIAIAATGLVAGIVGALAAGRLAQSGGVQSTASALPHAPAGVIVPPGWDQVFSARLNAVETELVQQHARPMTHEAVAPSAETPSSGPGPSRPEQRALHYEKEIEAYTKRLAEHQQESVDEGWAWEQGRRLRETLETSTGEAPATRAIAVDCRSKTCVGRLTFDSPLDALRYLHLSSLPVPQGCNGLTSTPLPPRGNGAYDLTILYTCRP
jgi:hypothetical protein